MTDQPILQEWNKLGAEEQKKMFPSAEMRTSAETFAHHADKHKPLKGDFVFRINKNMGLIMSTQATYDALLTNPQTAQALANLVTLDPGSNKHKGAIQTLLQLAYHKEKRAPKIQLKKS